MKPSAAALVLVTGLLAACAPAPAPAPPVAPFSVVEATIPEMQKAMQEGRTTSRQIVEQYLVRIALYNDKLNAVVTVNPKALQEADRLDQERKAGKVRGPLHEIPIALKSMADAIEVLKKEGATIVAADIPSVVDQDPKNNFLLWGGSCDKGPRDPNCSSVLWYGMKRDFNAWLASLGPAAPVKTLAELRAFNTAHANRNAIKYGQVNLDHSDLLDLEKDRAKWQADRDLVIEPS